MSIIYFHCLYILLHWFRAIKKFRNVWADPSFCALWSLIHCGIYLPTIEFKKTSNSFWPKKKENFEFLDVLNNKIDICFALHICVQLRKSLITGFWKTLMIWSLKEFDSSWRDDNFHQWKFESPQFLLLSYFFFPLFSVFLIFVDNKVIKNKKNLIRSPFLTCSH